MNDFVSIIIPVYNGYEYFDDCIKSIIEQEHSAWELLIGINGHGDDNNPIYWMLRDKINRLKDSRIRIFNFNDIKGAPSTINKLVSLAKYNWIAHIDIDDKWHPLKLKAQLIISNNEAKNCSIIGTGCKYFGITMGVEIKDFDNIDIDYGYLTINNFINKGNQLIHSSVLIKKELANYTDEFICYDLDCWLRSLMKGHIIFNIPYPLTYHRLHDDSFYNSSKKQDPQIVFKKYFG